MAGPYLGLSGESHGFSHNLVSTSDINLIKHNFSSQICEVLVSLLICRTLHCICLFCFVCLLVLLYVVIVSTTRLFNKRVRRLRLKNITVSKSSFL